MVEAPERIWVGPDGYWVHSEKTGHHNVEYVRADRIAALEHELAEVRAERDAAREYGKEARVLGTKAEDKREAEAYTAMLNRYAVLSEGNREGGDE